MAFLDLVKEMMTSKFKPCLIFLVLCSLGLLILAIYEFFHLFLHGFFAILLTCFLIFTILYVLILFLLFPGSFWMWRRHLENQFSKAISNKSLIKIKQLKSIIEYLLHKNRGSEAKNLLKDELIEIQKMINSYILTFQTMESQKTITSKQRDLLNNIINLQTSLKESRLRTNRNLNENSLWEWMENSGSFLFLLKDQVSTFEFEKHDQGEEILNRCQMIENIFQNIIKKHFFLKNMYLWLFNNTLGTIDQMRVELENRFKTKRYSIKTLDNKTLDCILILSNTEEIKKKLYEERLIDQSAANDNSEIFSNEMTLTSPIILFCNPNAGYYEYMYYESDWIEFYCKNGVNLFLWNYRGYGRSKGCPKPQLIQEDAEVIIDFLRKELKIQKIGVHGQSLGGVLACHLADKCNLDFLCADRTFYSLSQIVSYSFNSFAAKFFQFVCNWNENIALKYTRSKCYKVVTYDPKDEIINYMSSLQTGILKEVIHDRISNKINDFQPKMIDTGKFQRFLISFINCVQKKIHEFKNEQSLKRDFDHYYETNYFNAHEFNTLYNAFCRIMEIIVEMSKHKSTFKKMHKRFLSSDDAQLEKLKSKGKEQPPGLTSTNTGSLDSSLNVTTNISVLNISHFKEESISNMNDISVIKSGAYKEENSILFNNANENNEEVEEEHNKSNKLDLKPPVGEANDYLELLTDKEKNSEKFQTFILEVFSIFDACDAGGVTVNDVFLNYQKNVKLIFKLFFASMELWGSYNPIKMIAKKRMNLPLHHKFSLTKLKDFLKKLEVLLTSEKKNGFVDIVQQKVLNDLDLIFYYFLNFYEKIQKGFVRYKDSNQLITSPHNDMVDPHTRIQINKENFETLTINEQETINFMGNLLPLSCGHNGCFNKKESQIYEFHLRNSKLIE